METKVELYGYDDSFRTACKTGWGCGYVLIPLEHPILVQRLIDSDANFYLNVGNFSEEITLSEVQGEYYKIGFDTAHRWNNDTHNFDWVEAKAIELKKIVDDYTFEDAKKLVKSHLKKQTVKFAKYL